MTQNKVNNQKLNDTIEKLFVTSNELKKRSQLVIPVGKQG